RTLTLVSLPCSSIPTSRVTLPSSPYLSVFSRSSWIVNARRDVASGSDNTVAKILVANRRVLEIDSTSGWNVRLIVCQRRDSKSLASLLPWYGPPCEELNSNGRPRYVKTTHFRSTEKNDTRSHTLASAEPTRGAMYA